MTSWSLAWFAARHGAFPALAALSITTVCAGSQLYEEVFVPPASVKDVPGHYAWLETDKGRIVIRLLPEQAPQSVAHFAGLANATLEWPDPITGEPKKSHYYDGIPIDLAEAGSRFEAGGLEALAGHTPPELYVPPTEGKGPIDFDGGSKIGFTKFLGNRVSGVKFFITATGQPHLSRNHPCFGVVVEGREVVFNISQVKTYDNGRPIEPVTIHKVRVVPIGDPSPLPEPVPFVPTLKRAVAR